MLGGSVNKSHLAKIGGKYVNYEQMEIANIRDSTFDANYSIVLTGNIVLRNIGSEMSGNIDIEIAGNIDMEMAGNIDMKISENMDIEMAGNIDMKSREM